MEVCNFFLNFICFIEDVKFDILFIVTLSAISTLLVQVANLDKTKLFEKSRKRRKPSFDSTWQELSNEYQHDRV